MLLFHDLQSIFLETESREWFGDYGASGDVSRFGIVWFPDWLQSRVGRGTWQGLTQLPHLNSCSQEALLDRSICVTLETSKICQSLLVFYSRQISYWAVAMTLWCTALWRLTFSRSWLFEKKVSLPKAITPCHLPDNMLWRYEDWHFPAKFGKSRWTTDTPDDRNLNKIVCS